jgi:hypothetical protein
VRACRVQEQKSAVAFQCVEVDRARSRTVERFARRRSSGPVEDEWPRDNLVAVAQLAESLDRGSFELAMRIVPIDWWEAQLPDRPSTAEICGHRRPSFDTSGLEKMLIARHTSSSVPCRSNRWM